MSRPPTRWTIATAVATTGLQIALLLAPALSPSPAAAQTPASAKPPVQRGIDFYEQSRFDEAIALLQALVDRGELSGDEDMKAREILARSYVKKGNEEKARDMFKSLLRRDANWRPDPIRVPPDETQVFDKALTEFQAEAPVPSKPAPQPPPPPGMTNAAAAPQQEKKKGLASKWWVWAGGALLIGGIAAAAGGGGGGGGGGPALTPLPGPPPPPSSSRH